jgi:Ca-activated chloride channel family protein
MIRTPLLLALLLALPAHAGFGDDDDDQDAYREDRPARQITPGAAVTSGALRVARGADVFELPLLHTTVDAAIAGLVAEVEVTQTYSNPFDEPIEATYLFPLPDEAAVHALEMLVGDRRIVGRIETREDARRIYDRAKRSGQTAALLDQERPSVFTQRVANILPGESIEIAVSFVEVLAYEGGAYEWVMPLVVGPRYVPPEGTGVRGDDSAALDAPLSEGPTGNTVDVRVSLDAGMPIRGIRSPSHALRVDREGSDTAWIELDGDDVPNQDFILRYELAGDAPQAAALSSFDERGGHFLLLIQPPADDRLEGMITPKDLVFLVDTSCSQSGAPMEAAKRAMRYAIEGMNPEDTYEIMSFSSAVGPAIRGGADPASKARGKAFVDGFQGAGGTNMLAGVEAALSTAERDALRTVLMITDGYVGNEPRILGAIEEHLGRSRFFTLGTGSSVNRFLLDRAAQLGRGDVQVIRPDEDAQPAVERFYERIRNPLLTDIEVSWDGVELLDVHPDPIQDLFSGQPVVLVGRYETPGRGSVTLSGRLGNEPWSTTLDVDFTDEATNPALGSLWARRWIEDLTLRQNFGRAFDDRGRFEQEVTDLALRYSLMSEYTSFVAVDDRVATDGDPRAVDVPLETPEGVEFEAVAPTAAFAMPSADPSPRPAATGTTASRSAPAPGLRGGGGLGAAGLGTAGAGEGGGGYGRGSGFHGAQGGEAPGVGSGEAIVLGSIDKSVIDRVIKRHLARIRYAYERGLVRQPRLAGKLVIKFVIGKDGSVSSATVTSSTLADEGVEQAVVDVFAAMRFPAPAGGGIVIVSYPLVFQPEA